MSGNEKVSRRSAMKAGFGVLAGGIAVTAASTRSLAQSTAADEYYQPKIDRRIVGYQYSPGPDGHHCAICSNFIAPAACKVVDGVIDPNGYCHAYAPTDIEIK